MASKYRLESTGIDPGAHGQHQRVLDRIGRDMTDAEARASAYSAASSADWSGSPPATIAEALDRIAAAISSSTLGPIA
jgi:acyl-CoA reductase-like NAD-dependent aldehyde dehydrogenase